MLRRIELAGSVSFYIPDKMKPLLGTIGPDLKLNVMPDHSGSPPHRAIFGSNV